MADLTVRDIKHQLQQLDPYDFETLVAEVWNEKGYDTTVRQASGDRGVDVEARISDPIDQTILIQAKRYASNNTVGSEMVRKYATLYQQNRDADIVVIVTTGGFTGQAETLAKDLGVKIINGVGLAELVAENLEVYERFLSSDAAGEETHTADEDVYDQAQEQANRKKLRRNLDAAITEDGLMGERGHIKISWRSEPDDVYHDANVIYKTKGLLSRKFGFMLSLSPQIDQVQEANTYQTISSYPEVSKMNNKYSVTKIWVPKESDTDIEPDVQFLTKLIEGLGGRLDQITVHTFSQQS